MTPTPCEAAKPKPRLAQPIQHCQCPVFVPGFQTQLLYDFCVFPTFLPDYSRIKFFFNLFNSQYYRKQKLGTKLSTNATISSASRDIPRCLSESFSRDQYLLTW